MQKSLLIRVGPTGGRKSVQAVHVLPGLAAHTPIELAGQSPLLTITHAPSGCAVVRLVPPELMETVLGMLSRVQWYLSSGAIYKSEIHRRIAEEAEVAVRRYHEKQESALAKRLGGTQQPGSGNVAGYRRDVLTRELVLEAKWTDQNTYRLDLQDWSYLAQQAALRGRLPCYCIEFRKQNLEGMLIEVYDLYEAPPSGRIAKEVTVPDAQKSYTFGVEDVRMANDDRSLLVRWQRHTLLLTNMYRLLAALGHGGE